MEPVITIRNQRLHISQYDLNMNIIKNITFLFFFLLIFSCVDYQTKKLDKTIERKYFSSKGFALVYNDSYFEEGVVNKKLKNNERKIMHSSLKKNTPVKIINPDNDKEIMTKIYKKANYPKIFNLVISKKIATELELDLNNPYIEILEFKKNKTFVAKESNIFDEEKNVAQKAPVDKIEMDDLSNSNGEVKKKITKKNYSFTIVISDFYYQNSANNLKEYLEKETKIKKFLVKKIGDNKYRLSIGTFKNFNTLKSTYISLNNLGFEDLNIYNE